MFVPRALRLKGVRELQRPKTTQAASSAGSSEPNTADELVQAMEKTSTTSPAPQIDQVDRKAIRTGPRFTTKPITPEYLAQLTTGIELIFSDYAHHEESRSAWLEEHYRTVDGEEKFIHLSAIVGHANVALIKPEPTQVYLRQALQDQPSSLLETSENGYHVRRKPQTYPPKFLPQNSLNVVDDDGLSFWDQRTIYVEPHLRTICQTPGRVAHWLKEHGQLRPKWLPIQAVHMLYNSCAFIVLSGSVMHEDKWTKWREGNKPEDWKIMTKVEHTRRTAEYDALLGKENPKGMRRIKIDDSKPPVIARPAALPLNVDIASEKYLEAENQSKGRSRRKRKANKSSLITDDAEADTDNIVIENANDNEPSRKRRS